MKRRWRGIPINDCGEKLVQIKADFYCLEPHPYLSLGAPYGLCSDPWRLRSGVLSRLHFAQEYLQLDKPDLCFAIFDAWRPISVQSFMVEHVINKNCSASGLHRNDPSQRLAVNKVVKEVQEFWAPPSHNPSAPPPHSTGAAVDLTLSDLDGVLLDMGGAIDQLGSVSSPDHYLKGAETNFLCRTYHQRRPLLADVMRRVGFVQHPKEWWHFSYGDQLWAWECNVSEALYGACNPFESNERTSFSPSDST